MHYNFFKPLYVLVTLFMCQNIVLAQDYPRGFRIGYGINAGLPINSNFTFSLGADGRLQYDLTQKTSLSATTGYTHLFVSDTTDMNFIPLKGGFKSFLGNQVYILGEAGAAFGLRKNMGTSFVWAPGIGIATKHIDISLRYENYSKFDTGMVSVRLAYGQKWTRPRKKKK